MNLLDYIILIILIICALLGFKKGFINSVVAFAGTLLVIILAFYLKNPISVLLYEHLPFLNIGGKFAGMGIINILIYEGASYLITLVILSFILGIIAKISGAVNALVHATLVLTLPSKLLGMVVGFVEGAIISFLLVFIISLVSPLSSLYNNSKYGDLLVTKTPVLSSIVKNTYNSVSDIYRIATNHENNKDKAQANKEGLRTLLKYEIITPDSAEKLIDDGKLKVADGKEVIEEFRKEL